MHCISSVCTYGKRNHDLLNAVKASSGRNDLSQLFDIFSSSRTGLSNNWYIHNVKVSYTNAPEICCELHLAYNISSTAMHCISVTSYNLTNQHSAGLVFFIDLHFNGQTPPCQCPPQKANTLIRLPYISISIYI